MSWLYLVNGSLFVASQFLAFSAIKRLDPATLLGSGGGLMALGSVIAVSADSMPILVMGVVVFTVGEVLALPGVELIVSSIAPEQMLSSYFGLSSSVAGLGVAADSSLGGIAMASGGYSPVLLLAGLGCGVVLGMVVLRRRIITADVRGCDAETV
ncbi:MFS transporter [Parasphingorhabdus pacifica]